MYLIKHFLIVNLLILPVSFFCQKNDSLWSVFNNKSINDTLRLEAIDKMTIGIQRNNPDSSITLALLHLNYSKKLKNKKNEASALNNLSGAYYNKEDFPKALEYCLLSLKTYEKIKYKKGIANCYSSIGLIYSYQPNQQYTAIDYYNKALNIRLEINDKKGIALCYKNLGSAYSNTSNFIKALEYYNLSLKYRVELKDNFGISLCYINIGSMYLKQEKYNLAIDYFFKSLEINESINDKKTKAICYINLGMSYNKLADYNKAINYLKNALLLSKEINSIDKMRISYEQLSFAYQKTNNYKDAFNNYVFFKQLTDSIFNIENSKQFSNLKTMFEVEKKEAELKLKSEAEKEKLKAISLEEKKQQQIVIFSFAGVLIVVIIFSFFLYKRLKIIHAQKKIIELKNTETQAQKIIVENQKHKVEEHQKEILDSIHYAKRIQNAMLPQEKFIERKIKSLKK